jgi:hypothetical protein
MTEQEADVFAVRLTRIWKPRTFERREDFAAIFEYHALIARDARLGADVALYVGLIRNGLDSGWHFQLACDLLHLLCLEEEGSHCYSVIDDSYGLTGYDQKEQEFVAQWMPFFRRGCWLSGLPIEASAHEKAEWMQGFSHEELES